MDWATEHRVIGQAVAEMRRQQVPVTPPNIETVVNHCRRASGRPAPRPSAPSLTAASLAKLEAGIKTMRRDVTAMTDRYREPRLTELAQQAVKEHPNVLFYVDEQAGRISACIEPRSFADDEEKTLKARMHELQQLIDRPGTDQFTRDDARLKVQDILGRLQQIRRER